MIMILQPKTFNRLPDGKKIKESTNIIRSHKANITSYMWYILPLYEKFGEQVFDVAAKSLAESSLKVSVEQLKELAHEMRLPEKEEYYQKVRLQHIGRLITSVKFPID